jgi:cation:H+ antiporter
MSLALLQLLAGIALLFLGGNYLVEGSVSIARRFRVSPLVIGLTIVAFGTSAPELLVSLAATLKGNPDIAVGNVVGSNIANIGLVLGLSALILPVPVTGKTLPVHWLAMMAASIALAILSATLGALPRLAGLAFLAALAVFILLALRLERAAAAPPESPDPAAEKIHPLPLALLLTLASCAALAFGADWLVDGASFLATRLGVPEKVVGLTVVAVGTSLPELAASVAAALKKQMDISIGNIVGSNLFNILSILGFSSLVRPIPIPFPRYRLDLAAMLLFALLLALPLLSRLFRRPPTLSRPLALLLLALYSLYAFSLF